MRFRAHPSVSDEYRSTTSATPQGWESLLSEARKGLTLPQGNHFVRVATRKIHGCSNVCTDISNAAMQRAKGGSSWPPQGGESTVSKLTSLCCAARCYRYRMQGITLEPQGSVPQQCETGRCMTSAEVSAKFRSWPHRRRSRRKPGPDTTRHALAFVL